MAPIRLTDLNKPSAASGAASKEPIAICGLACRLPGDSTSPSKLWDLLAAGRSGSVEVPPNRFNIDAFYHPKGNDRSGSVITRGGYFLNEDTREFENTFFGINNLEATYMDPQQRKLLEVVYECLENAGIPLDAASGSNTGVYVGNFTFDYLIMQSRDADYLTRYNSTGMGTSILGNRISHVYNLKGPSLVVDTACSSSLYCLHVACVALENYECDSAIVAGANLIQSAEQHIGTMKAGVLSPTSQCHTFDASADGYGRAEGIGALYVKRLSDALRDGDPIRSVVRASAINANGKTAGIALPSADGQEAVVRKAMAKAGLTSDDISYIECHGTGTKVGDAIEVEGICRVFDRTPDRKVVIGSVKSNVGHSEAASGIAGLLKATLAIEKGQIPPTHGLKNLNPKLAPFERTVDIPRDLVAWPGKPGEVRRAGINSFGYGGANAHVIIEQSPLLGVEREPVAPQPFVVLPLSAATTASLEGRRSDLVDFNFDNTNILDLAYTFGSRRTNFQHRGYLLASSSTKLSETFNTKDLVTGSASSKISEQPLAFVFTGQGSQWAGMCKELFAFPVFAEAFAEMDAALQSIPEAPSWTLKEAVLDTSNPDLINTPQRSQPCCTAVQVALIQLLASWGIVPEKTVGHSSGEIAAAFAAGHLSAAESIVVAYYRGYCVSNKSSTGPGAMMAAGLSEEAAVKKISEAGLDGQIRVACVNSPEGVTISGDEPAIDSIVKVLQSEGAFARKLKTGGQAYHSHHMLAIGEQYQAFLEKTLPTLGPSTTLARNATIVSSVTTEPKSSGFNPAYWRSNLESQVRFTQAIKRIHADGQHTFLELGPHTSMELPVKQTLAKEGVAGSDVQYLGPIKRNSEAIETSLQVPAKLWLYGYEIDWNKVNGLSDAPAGTFRVVTDLPRYRFQYSEMLWSEGRPSIEYRLRKHTRHELLGTIIPGGNGDDLIYRNILTVSDADWIEDHRLENAVVFPGAGYLATVMEAIMRATDTPISEKPTFSFENVHVLSALQLSTEAAAKVEVFTSLRKSNITNATTSSKWWEFSFSTWQNGSSVIHAKGNVAITTENVVLQSKYAAPEGTLEPTHKRIWYDRLVKSGLNYGTHFQPITEFLTPSMTSSPYAGAKLPLATTSGDELAVYPVHPITLDAMLQTAIVSTSYGIPNDLYAKVPTRMGSLTIKTATAGPAQINANSSSVGFGAVETGSEIVDANGQVVAQFDQVRLNPYSTGAIGDSGGERHPMLRNLWKPDLYGLGFIDVPLFQKFMDGFVAEADSPLEDDSIIRLGAALDLAVHKNSRVRVLELGNDIHDITLATLDLLASKSDFKRAANYTTASFDQDGALMGGLVNLETSERSEAKTIADEKYHIVLVPIAGPWLEEHTDKIQEVLEDDGIILALAPTASAQAFNTSVLTSQAYPIKTGSATSVVMARKFPPAPESTKLQKYLIVERNGQSALGFGIENALAGKLVHRVQLHEVTEELVSNKPTVFNLVEAKDPLLSVINDEEMQKIKLLTDNAANIVWVTNGNITQGARPNFSLISGLARSLVLEQPSLKLYCYDIDSAEPDVAFTVAKMFAALNQTTRYPDLEFAQRGNLVHVSRFVPDDGLNASFRSKQGLHLATLPLKDAGVVRLDIANVGQYDSIFFKALEPAAAIAPTEIRVKVASAGVNAKDYYVLGGKVDVPGATASLEYAGIVEEVGSAVTRFVPGDHAVVMAPSHFQTYQTIPEWAAVKLEKDEDLNVAATLPVVWATAIYALHNRASLQAGESVLIHSGAGGVGIAAIQIAQLAGAEVYTTVSNDDKKKYLIDTFGLKPSNIFSSRGDSFLEGILEATGGKGVDVVLNSLTGDQLHATWKSIAECGRFVEIGKLDLTNSGRLEMDQFLKNSTFTAFDLTHLYASKNPKLNQTWYQLLEDTVKLWRTGKLVGFDTLQVFDISDATAAFRRFSSRNRMGKIAISLQNPESEIQVRPLKHATRFSPEKSYVMIGCLGGIGRTLTRWMLQRGAKKFAYLGRSGTDKPAARALVEDVKRAGGEAVVVRGSVSEEKDVQAVVAAAEGEIGGVVQAAMGLNEALFTVMPNEWWHTGIDPKVHGTWYIHNALRASGRDKNLDFFLMTSSISGSVGTATECNYCAGNYFLDIFARYRRSLGLPATSVGLGMISGTGYLHDNPEIEALLLRKGIQAIDQDELIAILDISLGLNSISGVHHAYDVNAENHILTGLEPMGLKELRKKGFEGTNPTLDDPRANLLSSSLDGQDDVLRQSSTDGLPPALKEAIDGGQELKEALLDFMRRRFGNLTLIKFDDVDVQLPFVKFGMDSMLAAEFRTWFYQSLKVDVPFLMFMDKNTTLAGMRDFVLSELEGSKDEEESKAETKEAPAAVVAP